MTAGDRRGVDIPQAAWSCQSGVAKVLTATDEEGKVVGDDKQSSPFPVGIEEGIGPGYDISARP